MSRKYFEAIGRAHASTGKGRWPAHYKSLPAWVREAIVAGYTAQLPSPGVLMRAKVLAAESMRSKP